MTKKEIVRIVSEELGLTQQQTKDVVQRTFDSIIETLAREGRIELRNFGVFEVKSRAARRARNPKTGQSVEVPEKCVVTFKPGKIMEERVRRPLSTSHDETSSRTQLPYETNRSIDDDSEPSVVPRGDWNVIRPID
ncbi:MAG: HU family DNA-binding protein [Planctomycetota bacterium]